MTREEARHWLEIELKTWEDECKSNHPIKEALSVAIEALEQETFINKPCCISGEVCEHDKNVVLDKIRAEIFAEMQYHSGTGEEVIQAYADGLHNAIRIIDKYKAEVKGEEPEK